MFVVILFAAMWLPYAISRLRHRRDRTPGPGPQFVAKTVDDVSNDARLAGVSRWTARDDLQLTRLLIGSAPQGTPNE